MVKFGHHSKAGTGRGYQDYMEEPGQNFSDNPTPSA